MARLLGLMVLYECHNPGKLRILPQGGMNFELLGWRISNQQKCCKGRIRESCSDNGI